METCKGRACHTVHIIKKKKKQFECSLFNVTGPESLDNKKGKINGIIKDKEMYLANSCGSILMLPCLITTNSHQMHIKTSFLYIVHLPVLF